MAPGLSNFVHGARMSNREAAAKSARVSIHPTAVERMTSVQGPFDTDNESIGNTTDYGSIDGSQDGFPHFCAPHEKRDWAEWKARQKTVVSFEPTFLEGQSTHRRHNEQSSSSIQNAPCPQVGANSSPNLRPQTGDTNTILSETDHSPQTDVQVAGNESVFEASESRLDSTKPETAQLDYSIEELQSIPFSKLVSQPFEDDPHHYGPAIPKDASMKERLRGVGDGHYHDFFSSLSIDQYDECGDLLVDHVGEILNKFKGARRERRRVAMQFEAEVAGREEHVQSRKHLLEQDLARLRKQGEDVIKGSR